MKRARRLVSTAAAASLAVAGLTACAQADPEAAVYFGDTVHLTNDRVQHLLDDAQDKAERASAAAAAQASGQSGQAVAAQPVKLQINRSEVVRYVLMDDHLSKVATADGLGTPTAANLPVDQIAQAMGTTPDAEIVTITTRALVLRGALQSKATADAAPTDADIRQVFDILVDGGNAEGTFEQFKGGLQAAELQDISKADSVRDKVQGLARSLKVKINPKYGPMRMPAYAVSNGSGGSILIMQAALEGIDLSLPVTDVSE